MSIGSGDLRVGWGAGMGVASGQGEAFWFSFSLSFGFWVGGAGAGAGGVAATTSGDGGAGAGVGSETTTSGTCTCTIEGPTAGAVGCSAVLELGSALIRIGVAPKPALREAGTACTGLAGSEGCSGVRAGCCWGASGLGSSAGGGAASWTG